MQMHTPPAGWDQAQTAFDNDTPRQRAAAFVWTLGILEVLIGGCCGGFFLLASAIPLDQLRQQGEQLSPEQWAQFQSVYPLLPLLGAGMLAAVLLPGLAYLALGFTVRRGSPAGVFVAQVFTLGQAIVVAALLLLGLLAAVIQRDPVAMTMSVLIHGTLLALLGYTFALLRKARDRAPRDAALDSDPWNP